MYLILNNNIETLNRIKHLLLSTYGEPGLALLKESCVVLNKAEGIEIVKHKGVQESYNTIFDRISLHCDDTFKEYKVWAIFNQQLNVSDSTRKQITDLSEICYNNYGKGLSKSFIEGADIVANVSFDTFTILKNRYDFRKSKAIEPEVEVMYKNIRRLEKIKLIMEDMESSEN